MDLGRYFFQTDLPTNAPTGTPKISPAAGLRLPLESDHQHQHSRLPEHQLPDFCFSSTAPTSKLEGIVFEKMNGNGVQDLFESAIFKWVHCGH
mmetsp:Transcript_11345/g.20592  ORF Transcript_11345/g.20592 Transcript_11345/m.20592 type:complete len:93 (-) Transcript_11345:1932-2210(-)